MKKSKKSRVSWPSDSMLCQVQMFLTEDCPAKVASQSSRKLKASNLPPGFEKTEYGSRRRTSHIRRIKWKRPPKFLINDVLLVGSGGESTETRNENLRIVKVLEAFYPHRSVIPTRPLVSRDVVDESYDDSKTPNIRLTPIEDECEESSLNSKALAAVSGLEPDLSLAASAALSALMKTKEQGSLVDADLLVKLLSDPNIVKNLTKGKPLETANNTLINSITKPRLAPQDVTSSAMNRNPLLVPVSVQSSVSPATVPPLPKPTKPMSSALLMNLKTPSVLHTYPSPRLQDSFKTAPLKPSPVDDVAVSEQKTPQSLNISTSSTWYMNKVLESDPQIRRGVSSMNINRDDQGCAKPVKNLDYFKNLIREHGGVVPATNETNNYKGRADKIKVVKVKKPCMYFGRAKGCKLGESCLFLHDRSKRLLTDVHAAQFPRAKRLKFGT